MESKILVAAGYPIGYIGLKENEVHSVELNGNIFSFTALEFSVWKECIEGCKYSNLIENMKKENINENIVLQVLNKLEVDKLIFNIEYENQEDYNKILKWKFLRQGFGIGKLNENENHIFTTEDVVLDDIEYLTWIYSNSKINVGEIINQIPSNVYNAGDLINAIIKVYRKGLAYIVEV